MRDSWKDARYITDGNGHTATVWQYTPGPGQHIRATSQAHGTPSHGIGPGTVGLWAEAIGRYGHAITRAAGARPWNHNAIGLGHDDATFAETGTSMAAYYESREAHGGPWWQPGAWHRRYYGPPGETRARAA